MTEFPVAARYIQTKNGSIIVLPDGEVWRRTETPGVYPPVTERLFSLAEAKEKLVSG